MPGRLLSLVQQIANEYLAEPYPTGRDLAKKYETNTQAISAVLAMAGASREHGDRKRLRNIRNGNPAPRARKLGKVIKPAERILCSKPHLDKPKWCILHEYPKSCELCLNSKEDVSGYRSCT